MAMNPMQKKARTSFILGVVITLLLTGIVIALLLFYVNKLNTEISTLNANRKKVYVLSQDVKSGEAMPAAISVEPTPVEKAPSAP